MPSGHVEEDRSIISLGLIGNLHLLYILFLAMTSENATLPEGYPLWQGTTLTGAVYGCYFVDKLPPHLYEVAMIDHNVLPMWDPKVKCILHQLHKFQVHVLTVVWVCCQVLIIMGPMQVLY